MDKEAESTKMLIQRLAQESDNGASLLFDDDPMIYNYFKGFFSAALLMGTMSRLMETMKCETELQTETLNNLLKETWTELFLFMDSRMDDYYKELKMNSEAPDKL